MKAITGFVLLLTLSGCPAIYDDVVEQRATVSRSIESVKPLGGSSPLPEECDDCTAFQDGCDDHGGLCTKSTCGTTRTERLNGGVTCLIDCADGYMHRHDCGRTSIP